MMDDKTILPTEPVYSASYIRKMLMLRHPEHYMIFADLFAMGCLLHLQGERSVGFRLVAQVVGSATVNADEPFITAVLKNLSGNEARFVEDIRPNSEISQLWDRARRTYQREAACAR